MVRLLPLANPPNPWATTLVEYLGEPPQARLHVHEEHAKSILSQNDSPDVGMKWSLNPYRGCFHGCAYCYARPSHQYWGFGAGTDFERELIAKVNAPELLREAFLKKSWLGESITFSGNTDCYQPLEASYSLTKRCLEVCLEFQNPIHVITKGALVRRDVALLQALAARAEASVTLSIPFADDDMGRKIEPYASACSARFETMRILAQAGIDVSINIAPVVPGLNDADIPELLQRARDAGASHAAILPVRLAAEVLPVFRERLAEAYPTKVAKVEHAIQQIRAGKMNQSAFGARMGGMGPRWEAIRQLFDTTCARLGLNVSHREMEGDAPSDEEEAATRPTTFRRPKIQQELF